MENIESLIQGSEKLTNILGYWPSFHDAEVLELHLWRGYVEPAKDSYIFPVLTIKVHVWELTTEVDSNGYLVLRHHTLVTLKFRDVEALKIDGFNHQNGRVAYPVLPFLPATSREWVPHSALFSQGAPTGAGGTTNGFRFSFWSSPHHALMANWIDNVHRKRTLLKTAKGCGTHPMS